MDTTKSGTEKVLMASITATVVSLVCVAAALFRTYHQKVPDQEVLLFLVTAVLVQYLDRVSKFKFGGLEFEKKVEDLQGRVRELAELNDAGQEDPRRGGKGQPTIGPRPSQKALPVPSSGTSGAGAEAPAPGPVLPSPRASLDEAVELISNQIYRPGLSWDDDPNDEYFTNTSVEGISLSARVSRSRNYDNRFLIHVTLHLREDKDLDDPRVAFFLHHTFRRRVRFEALRDRQASFFLTARGAFVMGAVLSDGTMVRLDLSNATLDLSPDDRDAFLSQ